MDSALNGFGAGDLEVPHNFNFYSSKVKDPALKLPSDFKNFDFDLAPIQDPSEFCKQLKNSKGDEKRIMQFHKGTTTLGFVFKEGVLIAVDSRASMGSFVGSDAVKKVIEINDYLLGTMAGGAADCYWEA